MYSVHSLSHLSSSHQRQQASVTEDGDVLTSFSSLSFLYPPSFSLGSSLNFGSNGSVSSSISFNKLVYSTARSFCASPLDVAQTTSRQSTREKIMSQMLTLDINSQIGSCMPLSMMRIGTMIHSIEMKPNQGGKLVRAAGTSAKILKEPTSRYVLVRLPSGNEKLIDTRCRATIGTVSNPSHKTRKLRKAGQARWLGRRPVVRGVAMNPVDHPHGGGEGRSKSSGSKGRTSLTPWGKPCKGGYKTGPLKRRK